MSDKGTIEQLRAELAQTQEELTAVDNGLAEFYSFYDDHGVCVMRRELERLQSKLTDACAARDALAAELADAQRVALSYLRMATERKAELAQARAELKDLHETDHKFGRLTILRNRDYWYDKAVAAECESDEWRKKAQAHLATLDAAEAATIEAAEALLHARRIAQPWFRRAQEAELAAAVLKKLVKELAEEHDQLVDRIEDAMRQIEKYDEHIAENHIQYAVEDILERLREAEQRATRAEALAQLVTPGLAQLLERLAHHAHFHDGDAGATYALAAQIRKALDDNKT